MAAALEPHLPEIVDLGKLGKGDLSSLLDEEIAVWQRTLDWDFTPTADIIRRFADMQSLTGFGLVIGSRISGYIYYVAEEKKGLIGDMFVTAEHRSSENENLLIAAAVDALVQRHNVRRVESQMMLQHFPRRNSPPFAEHLRVYERKYMVHGMGNLSQLPARAFTHMLRFGLWQDRHHEDAAHVIAGAYRGHVDGDINDQYRSVPGARRFLTNIVQYPGCGSFLQEGSWLTWLRESSMMCGLSLASRVAPDVGHITQICVLPGMRGSGAGYELMRRSLCSLRDQGCRQTSLTVTAANRSAIDLYERIGFQTMRAFPAMVWEGL